MIKPGSLDGMEGRKKRPRVPKNAGQSSRPRNSSSSGSSSQLSHESVGQEKDVHGPPAHPQAHSMVNLRGEGSHVPDIYRSYSVDSKAAQNNVEYLPGKIPFFTNANSARLTFVPRSNTIESCFNDRKLSTASRQSSVQHNTTVCEDNAEHEPALFNESDLYANDSSYLPSPTERTSISESWNEMPEDNEDITHQHLRYTSRRTNHDSSEVGFQRGFAVFNVPLTNQRWHSSSQINRNREDSLVPPQSGSPFDQNHFYEYEDAQVNSHFDQNHFKEYEDAQVNSHCGRMNGGETYIHNDPVEQEIWGSRANAEPSQIYDDMGTEKATGSFAALHIRDNEYRHPTNTTQETYQDSLPSSQSSRANSAESRSGRYPSIGMEHSESSLSSINSFPGNDQRGYNAQQVQHRAGSISRSQETRWVGNGHTAFKLQVDVWQDGHRSPYAPPCLNNRTLSLDTLCEQSNWVSRSIVKSLCAAVRRLPEDLEFSCVNGEPMIASEETTLCFRAVEGGMTRTSNFFVALVEVSFELLLGADDILRFDMLTSGPTRPAVMALVAKKQSKGGRKQEPIRVAEQNSRVEEHERKRKEREQRHKEREIEQQRERKDWSRGSEGGSGSRR